MMQLQFPVDRFVRQRYFTEQSFAHPAKLHLGLLQWCIDHCTSPGQTLADPMAGTGSLLLAATQQRNVILREVEPTFLAMCHENAAQILRHAGWLAGNINIGAHDARQPWGYQCDVIITSPPYGCSAGVSPQSHAFFSPSRYEKVKHLPSGQRWREALANPSHGTTGAMIFSYGQHPNQIGHWRGKRYWQAMEQIYTNAKASLRARGLMVLVLKDHIKDGRRVHTSDQTVALCQRLGFSLVERHARQLTYLSLWQRRRKEQGKPIIEEEDVLVFRKVSA